MLAAATPQGGPMEFQVHRISGAGFRRLNPEAISIPTAPGWRLRRRSNRLELRDQDSTVWARALTSLPPRWHQAAITKGRVLVAGRRSPRHHRPCPARLRARRRVLLDGRARHSSARQPRGRNLGRRQTHRDPRRTRQPCRHRDDRAGRSPAPSRRPPPAARREQVTACHRYLTGRLDQLHYDTALKDGWPIATSAIEGACRHLIADRLDITRRRGSRPPIPHIDHERRLRGLLDLPRRPRTPAPLPRLRAGGLPPHRLIFSPTSEGARPRTALGSEAVTPGRPVRRRFLDQFQFLIEVHLHT